MPSLTGSDQGNTEAKPSERLSQSQHPNKRLHQFGKVDLYATIGGRLDQLAIELKAEFPSLVFQFKADHWWWKVAHWFILIVSFGGNRTFLTGFTTTFGMCIGFSAGHTKRIKERVEEDRVWSVLMHEREHLRQFKKYSLPGMILLYGLVFFPVGLAYFRARFERAGYKQTLMCWFILDRGWAENPEAIKWLTTQFTGPNYVWSWPFKKTVQGWFTQELSRLQCQE